MRVLEGEELFGVFGRLYGDDTCIWLAFPLPP